MAVTLVARASTALDPVEGADHESVTAVLPGLTEAGAGAVGSEAEGVTTAEAAAE